jgi:hypothetical protein
MELSRKALEILRDCDQNKMACADCPPRKPPEQICYRFLWTRGEIAALALALMDERDRYRTALERLRDCDWTISLPDRMDAVRDIARAALEPR